jgi:hypothetical protein
MASFFKGKTTHRKKEPELQGESGMDLPYAVRVVLTMVQTEYRLRIPQKTRNARQGPVAHYTY